MRTGIRIVICSFMLLLLLAPAYDAFASAAKKRVLVLYAEGKELPAHELVDQAIRSAVKSDQTFAIELFTEYLNLSRFKEPRYRETLARFLGDKYSETRPDLVMTVAAPALENPRGSLALGGAKGERRGSRGEGRVAEQTRRHGDAEIGRDRENERRPEGETKRNT
jgi:hypothetical protein